MCYGGQGRETGAATTEENLDQKLASLCHEYLLQVFQDVRKYYDSLDSGRRMDILS